tara:strand:+ start:3899 stop:4162 length:264 start_codon:yes stop_codon:yes gene_type:complete
MSDPLVGYRIYTAEDTLTRAEKERKREINEQAVDDMIRLEGELDDVIREADALVKDGWSVDIEDALVKVREALALVQKRRKIVERHI